MNTDQDCIFVANPYPLAYLMFSQADSLSVVFEG